MRSYLATLALALIPPKYRKYAWTDSGFDADGKMNFALVDIDAAIALNIPGIPIRVRKMVGSDEKQLAIVEQQELILDRTKPMAFPQTPGAPEFVRKDDGSVGVVAFNPNDPTATPPPEILAVIDKIRKALQPPTDRDVEDGEEAPQRLINDLVEGLKPRDTDNTDTPECEQ